MFTKTLLGVGALLSLAAAVPLQQQNKRDVVWTTDFEIAYVTLDVTTTIWLSPGETAPAGAAGQPPAHHGHGHQHKHPKPPVTSVAAPAPSSPAETQPASFVAPTPSAAPETPTSPVVAPSPTTTQAPAPAPTSPAPVQSPSPTQGSGGGNGGSGQTFTGDMTYYSPGLGSCGQTNTDSDSIVALAEGMMQASMPAGGNPNLNPLCGKTITISWQGITQTATIMDTCPGCSGGSLDLTPSLFEKFAPLGEGRLTGMTWQYN